MDGAADLYRRKFAGAFGFSPPPEYGATAFTFKRTELSDQVPQGEADSLKTIELHKL
jgi:hypothetical protein